MTEKRFKLNSEVGFIDTQKCGGDTMTLFEVVVELNKLNEENEQLKSENQRLSEQKHIDFVKDCTAIEEELSNLKCANKKLLKSNDFLLKEHEKLTSVNQELRNELKFDEEMYKTFKEIIDEADDLITSHLSKHYQRQWKNFCKHRGVLDD